MAAHVDLANPLVISESRRVDAPAHAIFAVLRDPSRHREVDGSGMVGESAAPPISAVGDAFVVSMHDEHVGAYETRNVVVDYVPDRSIGWAPKRHDVEEGDWDHRWGWELTGDGDSTVVVAYFDCTRVPEAGWKILDDGEWARPILAKSVVNLAEIVEADRGGAA